MTTLERLDSWKTGGVISDAQHATLSALVTRQRFSIFVELNALLYLGVLSTVGGLTWTFRDYVDDLGDAAILSILVLLMTAAFADCVARGAPYAHDEVQSPSLAFDYVLYFGCLIFSAALGFIETRFGLLGGWQTHLLAAAIVFGGLAYRFDNRFVLSLALTTLAAYLGLKLSVFDDLATARLRASAMAYGGFLLGTGWALQRQGIKRHFLDVYLQLGANAMLLSAAVGALESPYRNGYLLILLMGCAAAIFLGVRFRRFAFVADGLLYGYFIGSFRLLSLGSDLIVSFGYFTLTGTLVVIGLVLLARRFGRDE